MLSMLASALTTREAGLEGKQETQQPSAWWGTYNPLPKALHDCCGLRECSTSSGAGVMRRRRCVRNGEAREASVVKSQPNSANGRGKTRGVHLMSQELGCVGLKSTSRTDACQARSSRVLVFRMIHGSRRRGESAQKRGQAARALAITH